MRLVLIKLSWILSCQLGLDPLVLLRAIRRFPRFWSDWRKFKIDYAGRLICTPCLHDRDKEGGSIKNEYFWQDLTVARWIYQAQPMKHVDVGSRVNGFVAHVASFREVEVIDVRPIKSEIRGIKFRQADLMRPLHGLEEYCDCLSCLHAIEHFGLGRYGDPIDPKGHEKGIANMAALLKAGGTLYLSTPIGRERVEFNANRVFDPRTIIRLADDQGLVLRQLSVFVPFGETWEVILEDGPLAALADEPYNLGIFVFKKR